MRHEHCPLAFHGSFQDGSSGVVHNLDTISVIADLMLVKISAGCWRPNYLPCIGYYWDVHNSKNKSTSDWYVLVLG